MKIANNVLKISAQTHQIGLSHKNDKHLMYARRTFESAPKLTVPDMLQVELSILSSALLVEGKLR